jgi:hypothetical protein
MIMKKIISAYKKITHFISLMTVMLTGVLAPIQNSHAQNNIRGPLPCSGYKIDATALRKAREAASNNSNRPQTLTPYLIRVYFHILRETNGANPSATEAQIINEFHQLSADYLSDNICFLNAGWDYVDNSQLDTNFNAVTDPPSLFDPYKAPYCINVFYLQKIKGTNSASGGGIGGTSFSIPSEFCIVAAGNIGAGQTTSHEVGHCVGILHTFETAYGYENIDGTYSANTGDLTSDTPADPYAHKIDSPPSCFSTSGCLYNGTCTDPNGRSDYTPPYTNLMSYWWIYGCYPSLGLTLGQYGWANSYLSTNVPLQSCESTPNYTQFSVNVTSGYHMASAIYTLTTSGNVNFSATAVATLGGGTVLLEPGFHAHPSRGGRVLIRGASCNFAAGYAATSKTVNKELALTNETLSLTCLPNPAHNYVTVSYQLHAAGNISITFFDITGKAVKVIQPNSLLAAGRYENKVYLGSIHSGMYFVKMIYNGQAYVTKLIVVK